jgi:ubiquinone/menaquinone biosynthesis C-methylase UbiE
VLVTFSYTGFVQQDNYTHWESLAAFHGTGNDRFYDLEALISGGSLMGADEVAALDRATKGAGVSGLDVMHLQSHIGCDSITMARQGARVTSVDFSPTALARLRVLAEQCGVAVTTVQSDARDLPHGLDDSFDLVYATIGVLCWIDNLDMWMSGVARVLRPSGTLVLVELHPLLTMIDSVDPLVLDFPYHFDGGHVYRGSGSYANRGADVTWTTTQYAHSVAEVVMAATNAGLRLNYLEEHTEMSFDPRGMEEAPNEADGQYRFRIGVGAQIGDEREPAHPLPVLFTFLATRQA